MWRIDGQQWTTVEALLALSVERSDLWHKALWEIAALPRLKNPPTKLEHPGVVEVPWPGARGSSTTGATPPQKEKKPEKDRYQKQRERIAFFT